jgi:hypothetical protein
MVAHPGATPTIKADVKNNLARDNVLRDLGFLDEFPRNATVTLFLNETATTEIYT